MSTVALPFRSQPAKETRQRSLPSCRTSPPKAAPTSVNGSSGPSRNDA
jgi:hypothetical protein